MFWQLDSDDEKSATVFGPGNCTAVHSPEVRRDCPQRIEQHRLRLFHWLDRESSNRFVFAAVMAAALHS